MTNKKTFSAIFNFIPPLKLIRHHPKTREEGKKLTFTKINTPYNIQIHDTKTSQPNLLSILCFRTHQCNRRIKNVDRVY